MERDARRLDETARGVRTVLCSVRTHRCSPLKPPRLSPRRTLEIATVLNMSGSGAYIAVVAVFLVYTRDISPTAAAICILVSTLGGKLGALPLSGLPNRFGGRATYTATKLLAAISMAAVLFASNVVMTGGLLLIYSMVSTVGGAARNLLIRDIAATDSAVFRARLRSLGNTGVVIGSLFSAGALAWDSKVGPLACVAINAISCLACAAVVFGLRIPAGQVVDPPEKPDETRPATSLRRVLSYPGTLRFLCVTAVFSLIGPIMTYAIPLWVIEFSFPRDSWPVGALIATNAVIVIAFQVPVGRFLSSRAEPGAMLVVSGALLAASCIVLAVSALISFSVSLAIVWAAVTIISLAEVAFAAATTEFLFSPAVAAHLSRTSTLVTIAASIGEALGPSLLLVLCLRQSPAGWLVLAVLVAMLAVFYHYSRDRRPSDQGRSGQRLAASVGRDEEDACN
ncbi:MFS transporter [Nocardia sp. NPDC058497]|uniref:MFS transporter n=1 Tax=Nocardia sp. NPDC058497 TaxID=3346529 RepID=UPI003668FB73